MSDPAAPVVAPVVPAPAPTLADQLGVDGAVWHPERDGIPTVVVPTASWAAAALALRGLGYIRFLDLTVVDLVETGRADRFELHLLVYAMTTKQHARLKTHTAAQAASLLRSRSTSHGKNLAALL